MQETNIHALNETQTRDPSYRATADVALDRTATSIDTFEAYCTLIRREGENVLGHQNICVATERGDTIRTSSDRCQGQMESL
jgi:hypothetical protein